MKPLAQGHIRIRTEKEQAPEKKAFAHSTAGRLNKASAEELWRCYSLTPTETA